MEELIKSEYPEAATGEYVTKKYLNFLADEYKSDLSKMLFATSLCSDDINVSTDFRKVLTRPFSMGGMGGLPYAGFTGMVAYAHHIPDNGDAFIFYGPHIGITDEGQLGKMRRPGQKGLTNSCGALMLALERMQQTNEVYMPHVVEHDYQQAVLENTLMPFKQDIVTAADPKKEITEKAYYVIDKQIHHLVKMSKGEFKCERIFLLGGIIINTSPEYSDYVDIRNFVVYNVADLEQVDPTSILKSEAFKAL
ncbi:hypothetical protein LVD15_21415 [Fulvivirga maritima]|uniref:hypothetical protein n=1 Tax=Fulvivirga maritima TaxID=2904247 RepID=UPI001F4753E0|nr:hypothetical protein [Fulvivirga maritima]UII25834.1 hypothetical protein LVD15_21415 [Fulvivirga maritima]